MLKKLSFVLLLLLSAQMTSQEITGTVSDTDGPLPGASVFVEGTSNGVVTDFDGRYSLKGVSNGATIIFSYVGYSRQEISYTNQTVLNVTLQRDLVSLDEVVLVSYGKQRNTPVSVVDGEELSEFPNTDIGQALQGRAAGVTITNGGSPGSQTLIQIRGVNTFGDGTPLFVVDGVFTNSINSIDLASIEKIDVLKDAASLSVYGSRGTNGVILITTKKGKVGNASFTVNASSGVQEFNDRYDVLNTQQYIQFLREVNALAGQQGGPDFPVDRINLDPNFNGNGVDTNWQDAYFRQAPIYNISANVNGGSEKARYNVGFSRLDQQGIFIDTGFSRTTLNINTDAKISEWLDIGQTLSLGHNRTVSPERDGGRDPFQNILGMAPYIEVGNPVDGFGGTTELDLNDSRNQIRIQNSQDNLTRFSSAIGSVFVNAKIFDGLSFRSQFGLNASLLLQDNERRAFAELGTFANPINFVDKIRQTTTQTIFTNTLAFDKDFGKHSVNASAVLEQTQINFESGLLSDNQEISSEIPEIFSPNASSLSFSVPENLNSVLFLAGYEFDNRYSISGSGRRDTSSRFSPENASQWFFSGAFGYDISNEKWFDIDFINSFKFRGSYGETGNNRTGNVVNQFLPTLGLNLPTVLNDVVVPGISPNNAANPDLRWETQIKQNYGFSSGFLYDQIQFSMDYFKNRSEDLLIPVELPSSAGIPGNSQTGATVIRNVGIVDVEGLELTLGYNDYKGEFKWNFWANVTRAEARVERLGLAGEPIERARLNPPFASALNRLAVGEAPFHFFGLVADGVYSTQAEIDEALPNNGNTAVPVQPGDVRYRDINGDGLIDLDDRAVIGNPNPDFTYAVNLRADYRGWDFDVLFNGVQGVDILNSNVFYLEGLDNGLNYGTQVLRRWQNPGDITDIPRFRFGNNINNEISSRYIEDGSFLRLRNVTVGYTFPNTMVNKSGNGFLKKFRVYAQGQNLLTFTNYSGLDPEVAPFYNAAGLVDGLGIDRSAQPRPITVITGIQLEF